MLFLSSLGNNSRVGPIKNVIGNGPYIIFSQGSLMNNLFSIGLSFLFGSNGPTNFVLTKPKSFPRWPANITVRLKQLHRWMI